MSFKCWSIRAVIYRPKYGNYRHWALAIEQDDTDVTFVYEVVGSHGTFRRNIVKAVPENSGRFLESIYLGEFADRDLGEFKNAVEATEVDNETVEWDCQDYVLEILDKLEEECIVDGDDRSYQKRKRGLKNKRGSE